MVTIQLDLWPNIESKWLNKKDRHWPDQTIIDTIASQGWSIATKCPKSEKEGDSNKWRISFSTAEIILSEMFTPFQRKCYLVAKCIYYTVIKKIDGDVFGSYFIKTVMFKTLEKEPEYFW